MQKSHLLSVAILLLMGVLIWAGCAPKELTSAKVYIQQDDWDKAIEQLELCVQTYPSNAEAHYLLGEGYAMRGEFGKMNKEFDASLTISVKFNDKISYTRDKYWVDNFNSGVKKVEAGKFEEAIKNFKTCLVIDAKRPEAYRNLAYTYIQTDQADSAIETYQKLLEINPQDVEALISLGTLYYNNEKYQETIVTMEKVLEIEPNNLDAIANIALAYDFLGERDKAFEAYQKAIATNPEDKDLIFNLGRLFYMRDDYEKAIEQFEKVLEMDPEDYDANVNTGNAYLSIAEKYKKRLKEIEEKGESVPKEEIEELIKKVKENFNKAIPCLEKAIQLKPDDPNAWYNLGVAYVNIGMSEKGKEAFKKSDELKQEE